MLKDVEIKELSSEIDDMLILLRVKYHMSALSLSAVITARLIWANREDGSEHTFMELLQSVAGTAAPDNFTNYSRH